MTPEVSTNDINTTEQQEPFTHLITTDTIIYDASISEIYVTQNL